MRLSNTQAVSRPDYGDRNPVNRTQSGGAAGAAPHGATTRWTYTVPAGKKARIDVGKATVQRATAATVAAQCESNLQYTPSGGALQNIVTAQIFTNAVGDQMLQHVPNMGIMLAGDILAGEDDDSSTAGTASFVENAKIFEYDA